MEDEDRVLLTRRHLHKRHTTDLQWLTNSRHRKDLCVAKSFGDGAILTAPSAGREERPSKSAQASARASTRPSATNTSSSQIGRMGSTGLENKSSRSEVDRPVRPILHFTADSWINDPCAPGYDPNTGVYHLFYQCMLNGHLFVPRLGADRPTSSGWQMANMAIKSQGIRMAANGETCHGDTSRVGTC